MSNFKIISSYHSTNLYTTSMAAESFEKTKQYIAGISDLAAAVDLKRYSNISELAALARHSLGS